MIAQQVACAFKVSLAAGLNDCLMLVDRHLARLRRAVEIRTQIAVDVCVHELQQKICHRVLCVRGQNLVELVIELLGTDDVLYRSFARLADDVP